MRYSVSWRKYEIFIEKKLLKYLEVIKISYTFALAFGK